MNLNQTEKKYENNKSYMLTESYNNITNHAKKLSKKSNL